MTTKKQITLLLCKNACLILIGFVLGLYSHDWFLQTIIGQKEPTPTLTTSLFCERASLYTDLCSASNIDPILHQRIKGVIKDDKGELLFPITLRVEVSEMFTQLNTFPQNRYQHSKSVFGVDVSSLDELLMLSKTEGVLKISEFEEISIP